MFLAVLLIMIHNTFLVSVLAILWGCGRNNPAPIPEKDTAAPVLPLTIHTVLTHSRDTSLAAIDTTTYFDSRDTIHGLIRTEHAQDGMALEGQWYYLKTGQKIAENSARLSAGTNVSHFDLINANPWPLGKYKLFVLLDSVIRDSAEFSVENKR